MRMPLVIIWRCSHVSVVCIMSSLLGDRKPHSASIVMADRHQAPAQPPSPYRSRFVGTRRMTRRGGGRAEGGGLPRLVRATQGGASAHAPNEYSQARSVWTCHPEPFASLRGNSAKDLPRHTEILRFPFAALRASAHSG